jgi:limonene-1,2-epoxide hydrolase
VEFGDGVVVSSAEVEDRMASPAQLGFARGETSHARGVAMESDLEDRARAFFVTLHDGPWDAELIDRTLGMMSPTASYHVHAWMTPMVGQAAIRAELERQAPMFSDLHCEIVTIASAGSTVLMERLDSMNLAGVPVTLHVAGVLVFDDDARIEVWRDYIDYNEVTTALADHPDALKTLRKGALPQG